MARRSSYDGDEGRRCLAEKRGLGPVAEDRSRSAALYAVARKIESVMTMLRHRGQEFEKIALDPGAFISWRATNWRGRPEAGAARSAYAAAILAGQAVSRHRSDSRP